MQTIKRNGTTYYQCTGCGLFYVEEDRARQCEAWCVAHQSCNLEITKYAVQRMPNPDGA